MKNCINYELLARASKAYTDYGYQRIEVPWWVTTEISNITKPASASNYVIDQNGKCLVASAEQSFLYLVNKGYLPYGRYQAITPCFRNEAYDSSHSKHFMKLELFELLDAKAYSKASDEFKEQEVKAIALSARNVMGELAYFVSSNRDHLFDYETNEAMIGSLNVGPSIDIMHSINKFNCTNKIEVGSYGMRSCEIATWIYGTGLAEPRFSKALAREHI